MDKKSCKKKKSFLFQYVQSALLKSQWNKPKSHMSEHNMDYYLCCYEMQPFFLHFIKGANKAHYTQGVVTLQMTNYLIRVNVKCSEE